MTEPLFRTDPYLFQADATVTALTEDGGVVVSASIFYPAGGGQPGDVGALTWEGGEMTVTTAVKGAALDEIALIGAPDTPRPPVGAAVRQVLDRDIRMAHMRIHTALHLLSVAIPLPVTGGQIGAEKGRLDFDMPDAPGDKDAIEAAVNAMIDANHPVTDEWITDAELDANPGLVKTMSVQPPRGSGRVRLVRIGTLGATIDLQPCGGTHVRATGEIGRVRIGKIEKKGRLNRRVSLHLD
jgi:misacylated tRNA(Ala) deacylase